MRTQGAWVAGRSTIGAGWVTKHTGSGVVVFSTDPKGFSRDLARKVAGLLNRLAKEHP